LQLVQKTGLIGLVDLQAVMVRAMIAVEMLLLPMLQTN
jgi:hypothetical protein